MSAYERFIKANHALFTCMESVSHESFNAMSSDDQQKVCHSERNEVAAYLKNDSVNFRNLLNDRIAALKHVQQ